MDLWEVRKQILYGDNACPSHLQSQSSVRDLGGVTGDDGQRSGKLDKPGKSDNINSGISCVCACVCACGSAQAMVVGAWLMGGALRQLYYLLCYVRVSHTPFLLRIMASNYTEVLL